MCAALADQAHEEAAPASKYITVRQATNIMEAVRFAKMIDLPLVAHLTIHWSLTDVGDDPNGTLFSKFREGLGKWLNRHGIEFAGAWARERQSRGQSDVVHCHLLFHLPVKYRSGERLRSRRRSLALPSDMVMESCMKGSSSS